jgi:hypothetical protein
VDATRSTPGESRTGRWSVGATIRFSLAPPEYVIIRKLQFYREGGSTKHLRDILAMVSGLGPDWDRRQLEDMIAAYGLAQAWRDALESDG